VLAFRNALRLARLWKDLRGEARVLRLTCIFWQPEKVLEATDRALDICRRAQDVYGQAQCHNNIATQLIYQEELTEAQSHLTTASELLDRCCMYSSFINSNNFGVLAFLSGNQSAAQSAFEQALRKCDHHGDSILVRSNLCVVMAASGDPAAVLTAFKDLAELA